MSQKRTPGRWRRFFPYAVGFVIAIPTLVGLNGVRGIIDRPSRLESGSLVILSGSDTSAGGQRQKLIVEWNNQHPHNQASIVVQSGNADLQHSGMISYAQNKADQVDVYNLDVPWIPEFAANNYIQPLLARDTDGFLPQPLSTCWYLKKQWAVPFNTDAGLLYYRTDILGQRGDTIPQQLPPSPAAMRQITSQIPSDVPTVQAGYVTQLKRYEGLTVNALEAIWNADGNVVSDDRVVMSPDQVARALAPLVQAATAPADQKPGLLTDPQGDDEETSALAFASGSVTMMRNWPVWYDRLKQRTDEAPANSFNISTRFAVHPLPHSVLGGQDLAIAAHTTKPHAANALIKYLTNATSEGTLFGDGGLPATREATYHDPYVQSKQPYAQVLLDSLSNARARPTTTHYPLFSDTFQDLINQALHNNGKLPPDAVARLTNALAGRLQ